MILSAPNFGVADFLDNYKNVVRDIEAMFAQLSFEPGSFLDNYKNVLADCEKMFNGLNFQLVEFLDAYKEAKGETRKQYRLDRDLTMTLVTKYDTARRYAVVRRWRELEEQEAGRELSEAELIEKMVAGLKIQPSGYVDSYDLKVYI